MHAHSKCDGRDDSNPCSLHEQPLSRCPIVESSVVGDDLKRLRLSAIKARQRLGQAVKLRVNTSRLGPRRSEDDHVSALVSARNGQLKGVPNALGMLEVGTVVVDA